MNEITLTVLFKGIGMLAAIIGGILIARWGFHLYKDGVGSNNDHAAFEVGPVKITAKSVGSVVMSTAFLWAYAGVLLSPNLDKSGEDIKVYSFNTPSLSLESIELTAQVTDAVIDETPGELEAVFVKALEDAAKSSVVIKLNGMPASIQYNRVKTLTAETGEHIFTTGVSANGKTATLAYEPSFENGNVIFRPAGVGMGSGVNIPNKSLQPTQ